MRSGIGASNREASEATRWDRRVGDPAYTDRKESGAAPRGRRPRRVVDFLRPFEGFFVSRGEPRLPTATQGDRRMRQVLLPLLLPFVGCALKQPEEIVAMHT